ncbi:ThuA domain-containing protein [Pontibacter harenae]|uniref:ThuA domain-containing protein n=1 Tax=Pontibacter harenae TaxID=2894083 RepID=UPI001E57D9B0|nr:ThuA domain-containing protein [Pontibacter harenae]MCC9166915.1 ThuA domain-containing protein [Pontibacter harenae]
MKKNHLFCALALFATCGFSACNQASTQGGEATATRTAEAEATAADRILVYSNTNGYRHQSIEEGIAALQRLGQQNGVQVRATEDSTMFVADTLKNYKAVIFLSTTQDVLNSEQETAFEEYIRGGGGYVGIHAAADTEYDWPWYNQLVGAYFLSHPEIQKAAIDVVDKSHASTSHLPDRWEHTDEWYNYKDLNPNVTVVARLDETSYKGGANADNHPIAWYHEFDGGKAFYTGLGHTHESYSDSLFLKHLWGGIEYAMGK